MSAKRLSDFDRREIIKKILEHRFEAERKAQREARTIFAEKLYHHFVPAEVLQNTLLLPEGWVEKVRTFYAKIGSDVEDFTMRVAMPVKPDCAHYYRVPVGVVDARHPLADEYQQLEAARMDLNSREDDARIAAKSLIYRTHSLNSLLKQWPEVAPFVGHITRPDSDGARSLPVVQVEAANALLGLPVEETESKE